MKKLFVVLAFFSVSSAFAQTNVAANWTNAGQTLQVVLTDTATAPYSAAQLWNLMAGSAQVKSVKTKNLDMTCTAQNDATLCTIKMAKEKVDTLSDAAFNFFVMDAEGKDIIAGLKPFGDDDTIRVRANGDLLIEANKTITGFGLEISQSLVSAQ